MIFRARLGGGGRSSGILAFPESARFRCIPGEAGGELFIAAGGNVKDPSISVCFSSALGPVEVAGVGGYLIRGIVVSTSWRTGQREPSRGKELDSCEHDILTTK